MCFKIKNRVEQELTSYLHKAERLRCLKEISPPLYRHISEFISRKGKRIRPVLFVIGYLGYAQRSAAGLYRSALSLELLHDFMLVHDDIIDKSITRRGRPSMHTMLNNFLRGKKDLKFSGEDLTIVIGDIMFALALDAFLAVKEDMQRKETTLKKLIEAAMYTGSGEFIELLYGLKDIDKITRNDIYKIYDYKTANYTFSSPLVMGATLAGAKAKELNRISHYGIYLGRAFQIKDDILGLFSTEKETGKSNLADIHESKKTILIWHAAHHSSPRDKLTIKQIFKKKSADKNDLLKIRRIVSNSGALNYAKNQVNSLIKKAESINKTLRMRPQYKNSLNTYSKYLLGL